MKKQKMKKRLKALQNVFKEMNLRGRPYHKYLVSGDLNCIEEQLVYSQINYDCETDRYVKSDLDKYSNKTKETIKQFGFTQDEIMKPYPENMIREVLKIFECDSGISKLVVIRRPGFDEVGYFELDNYCLESALIGCVICNKHMDTIQEISNNEGKTQAFKFALEYMHFNYRQPYTFTCSKECNKEASKVLGKNLRNHSDPFNRQVKIQ